MNTVLIGVLGYVLVQLIIGAYVSRRIRTESDYLIAGRSLGYGLAVFTVFATWFGAETCIGAAGAIYEDGLSGGSADPFGYAGCLFLMGLVFAVPLWRRKLTTIADLFRTRYSAGVERFVVLLMVPTSLLWAAAQIRAFGQVLSASSEFDVALTITIAAGVVIVYTVSGGLLADAVTDLVQGVALIIGLVVVFVAVLGNGGAEAFATLEPERLRPFGGGEVPTLEVLEAWAIPVFGSVMAAELVARVIATRSPEVARRSCLIGGGVYLLFGLIPVFIGLVGFALRPGLEDPEQILLIAREHLPVLLYTLFAGALVSAILSTVDSALLVASSLVSHNLILPLRPGLSEAAKVRLARIGVVLFGVLAYVMALYAERVYDLVEQASAFGSSGIFVVAVFGLFTGEFGYARSAFAALLTGVGVWTVGSYVLELPYAYLGSLGSACAAYLLFALVERRPALALARTPRAYGEREVH